MISNTKLTRNLAKLMLVAVLFVGCKNSSSNNEEVVIVEDEKKVGRIIYDYGWNTKVRIFEIDSCEYIGFDAGSEAGTSIIHKQNCKFCAERSKK
jgi:hypothetical protein